MKNTKIYAVFVVLVMLLQIINIKETRKLRLKQPIKASVDSIESDLKYLKSAILQDKATVFTKLLLIYQAYNNDSPLELYRHGRDNDGGYVIPKIALEKADVLLGYGIADDVSFEEQFSLRYNKPSYGFDCSINDIQSKSNMFHFVKECIANKEFIYNGHVDKESAKVSTFSSQIKRLKLDDKKVFIKMDIEGAEYEAFDDILMNHKNITGIALEIHISDTSIDKAIKLLSNLRKDFVLIHVHGNNFETRGFNVPNAIGKVPYTIELSLINKSLINKYHVALDQLHPNHLDMPNCKTRPPLKFEIINLDN